LLTPHLLPGDAVSRDVLAMLSWFRHRGHAAEAYAEWVHPTLVHTAQPIGAYESYVSSRDDIVICHHSGGWPLGLTFWRQTRNRRVLRYHNVTPPRFYQAYCPSHADSCRMGEEQTRLMLRYDTALLLPASEFNGRVLEQVAPRRKCRVVPPFHAVDELEREPLDHELAERMRGAVNLLFVGRVAPNKGFHHLLRVIALLKHSWDRLVRFWAVGGLDPKLRSYHDELHREMAARGLANHVQFTGKISSRQLATYYRCSNFFLCMSEHEGFCVPLVEAMAFRLPIVAYAGGAVPSTLGRNGLHWEALDPVLIAESIRQIHENSRLRESLILRQREHYEEHFAPRAIERLFAEAMGELMDLPQVRTPTASRQQLSLKRTDSLRAATVR
jgi:glycosyltransferase involved in cell wall biosynthesis